MAAHRGNARRIRGDLPAAAVTFSGIRAGLREAPAREAGWLAEILGLEASLRIGQRSLARACRLVDAERQPCLYLCTLTGRLNALADLERFAEAEALLEHRASLYRGDQALSPKTPKRCRNCFRSSG